MAEENGKKEFTIYENPEKISELKDMGFKRVEQSVIGRAWGNLDKGWTVYLPVPENDEQAKELYNLTCEDLMAQGVQKIFTQGQYETVVIATEDGKAVTAQVGDKKNVKQFDPNLTDEQIHQKLQETIEAYRAGVRAPGKAKKDKETLDKLAQLAAAQGITKEEYVVQLLAKHGG